MGEVGLTPTDAPAAGSTDGQDGPGAILRWASVLVIAASTAVVVAGSLAIGSSTDDAAHVDRLTTFFQNGWYVLAEQLSGGAPTSGVSDEYVYAPVTMLLQQAAVALGLGSGWTDVVATPEAMMLRHSVVAVLGVLGAVAVGGIVREASASWAWGAVGAAVCLSIPLWVGYGMFNNKDVPVATGYTLTTWGLAVLAGDLSARRRVAGGALVLLGFLLAVGTRPGIWPALVLSILCAAVLAAWACRNGGRRPAAGALGVLGPALAGVVGAWIALVAVYPTAFTSPLEVLAGSARTSAGYGDVWYGYAVTDGAGHGLPPPLGYVPTWALNQLPLLVLVAGTLGIGVAVMALGRLLASEQRVGDLVVLLCAVQLLAVPLFAIATRTTLYGGLRHLLFAVPAAAALSAIALRAATLRARPRTRRPLRTVAALVVACGLLLPVLDGGRLFPYHYVYFNELATTKPIEGRWTLEYYNVSLREVAAAVDTSLPAYCGEAERAWVLGQFEDDALPARDRLQPCADRASLSMYAEVVGGVAGSDIPTSEFWYVRPNRFSSAIPSNCTVVDSVQRTLRTQQVTLAYVARCSVP